VATNKEKLIAGAQKLVEKNQFDKAIKEYLKVVATDDKDVRIWLKIGDLYAKLGKKPEATETYQRVAQFYSEQGFYLKAVAVYKQILKLDPRLIDINQRLAELYKQLGLLSDAMSQYEQVATFFHREGKTREALSALKQIVELDPETIANRIKLAELYSQQQMVRESIEEFTRAAEQLKDAQRTDEYMRVAERLLFLSPDNRPVSKELARLYIERQDPRRALPKLQVCFKADPRDTEVLSLLARAFESLDQRQKAVSVLKELARVLGENGERQRREETFRRILSLNPGDPDAEAALSGTAGPPAPRQERPNLPPLANTASVMAIAGPQGTGARPLVGDAFPARAPLPPEPTGLEMPPADEFDVDRVDDRARQTAVGGLGSDKHRAVPDEEAVARILNETDVYIKYRLYAKAIEHLQRVFELDGRNVEAREKLKALYLAEGKQEEAVLELWSLTELVDPARQRRYLREILELEPDNARAAQMLNSSGLRQLDGPESAADTELLDDDMIEEMPVDDYEESTSDPIVLPAPVGLDADDDLIPLVVQPVNQVVEEPLPEVEDRFGTVDDDDDGFVVEPASVPPRRAAVDDDHDVRTRFDDQALRFVDSAGEVDEADLPPPPPLARVEARQETSIEDDLDEADFFIQQNLFDEARQILEALLARHAGHPLVAAKLRDVESAQEALGAPAAEPHTAQTNLPEEIAAQAEALAAELPEDLPGSTDAEDQYAAPPEFELTKRGVIEKGVTAEDFETHYDLGIAYKEMGLIDDAINEFRLVMKDQPREVQCHLMIGLCLLEKGQQTDAIGSFKKGLYVDGITEREGLTLYFELGQAYERLKDTREAMYYFEKVQKRDARFRGVERRIEGLRSGVTGAAEANPATPSGDDLDAAFDGFEDR